MAAGVVGQAAASLDLQWNAKGAAARWAYTVHGRARAMCQGGWHAQPAGTLGRSQMATNQPQRAFPIEPFHSERCDRIAHVQTVICSPLRNVSAIRLDAAQQTSLIFPRFHIYSKAASVEDAGQRPMPLTPAMRPSSHSRLLLPAVHVAHSECLKSHEHRAG